jgi:hypothetical protein
LLLLLFVVAIIIAIVVAIIVTVGIKEFDDFGEHGWDLDFILKLCNRQ